KSSGRSSEIQCVEPCFAIEAHGPGGTMRGQAVALAMALIGGATPASAQSEPAADEPRTAEQFIEAASDASSVIERSEPCPTPVGNEIVVCRERIDPESQRLSSPTERAN